MKMNKVEGQKIIRNLVTLEKYLILHDHFQRLSVQKRISTKRVIDLIMKNDSQSLDYCLRLMCRGPKAFSQKTTVDYAIDINCIEDTHCKLKTVTPVLERSVIPTLEVSYGPTIPMINMINGKILA